MRLVRVGELFAGGGWFDSVMMRDNAPFGFALHWTRPFDLLLLALALPLTVALPFETALFWAGIAISPLLHLALLFAFVWALVPLVPRDRANIAALLLLAQPAVFAYAIAGYADHHVLLFLCFVLTLGWTVRAVLDRGAAAAALYAGAAAGVGVWLSIELLIGAAVCTVALGLAWVDEGQPRYRANLRFALGFLAAVIVGLLAERGPVALAEIEYDRISVVHAAVAGLLAAFWAMIGLGQRLDRLGNSRPTRLALGGLGGAMILGVSYAAYPGLFAGALAAVDPRLDPIWHEHVREMAPLWPDSPETLVKLAIFLGLGAACLPFIAKLLTAERGNRDWWGWLLLGLGALACTFSALSHQRLSGYAEIVYVMILALMFDRMARWCAGLARANFGRMAMAAAFSAAIIGPVAVGFAVKSLSGQALPSGAAEESAGCSVAELAPTLNDRSSWIGAEPRTILAMIDFGPELLYRTRHRIVGSPYHRNVAGILDAQAALAAGEDDTARSILAERGVDILLLCPTGAGQTFFAGQAGDAGLYRRLLRGEIPDWLEPMDPPSAASSGFRLYRLVGTR